LRRAPVGGHGRGGGLRDRATTDDRDRLPIEGPERTQGGGDRALTGGGLVERRCSILGTGERGEVVRLDADPGAREPAAALYQRRDLLEEGGERRVAAVGLGVEPGRATTDLYVVDRASSSAPSRSTFGACRTTPTAGASPRSKAMNPSVLSSCRTSIAGRF
jgi:hypothetical protein